VTCSLYTRRRGWGGGGRGGEDTAEAVGVGKTGYPRNYEQLTLKGFNQPEQGMLHRGGANIH
jgi:hypothetical protein